MYQQILSLRITNYEKYAELAKVVIGKRTDRNSYDFNQTKISFEWFSRLSRIINYGSV